MSTEYDTIFWDQILLSFFIFTFTNKRSIIILPLHPHQNKLLNNVNYYPKIIK